MLFYQKSLQKTTQEVQQKWFPQQLQISSHLPPPLHGRVKKRKGSHNCSNNKNGKWNCDPSQKWTHRQVFESDMDASRSSQRIQIYQNIHKCICIKFYLSAMTSLLSSWFFTPFDVSEDSDWLMWFIAWRHGVTRFLCRRLGSVFPQ